MDDEAATGNMTSRLKHKLEIENINTKSRYLNESFVQVRPPRRLSDWN